MTTEAAKPLEEDLSRIEAEIVEAQTIEATAHDAWSTASGLLVLGEIDQQDASMAEEALAEAKRRTAALLSAQNVLTARSAASAAQQEQERVDRLRKESASAQSAQTQALSMLAKLAGQIRASLDVVKAQGTILTALHQKLVEADPEQAETTAQDYRAALARLGTIFTAKRAEVRSVAGAAQYRVQQPGDGSDPTVEVVVPLLDDAQVLVGAKCSAARATIGQWEVEALSALDDEMRSAQEEAFLDHTSQVELAGLGHLGASLSEVRAASNLDAATVGLLLDDSVVRSLIGLTGFLPSSANEGVGVRTIAPRSALESRQEDQMLKSGVRALHALASPN